MSSALEVEWGLGQAVGVGKGVLYRGCNLGKGPGFERAQCSWRITGRSFSSTRVLGVGGSGERRVWRGGLRLDLPPLTTTAPVIRVPSISYLDY